MTEPWKQSGHEECTRCSSKLNYFAERENKPVSWYTSLIHQPQINPCKVMRLDHSLVPCSIQHRGWTYLNSIWELLRLLVLCLYADLNMTAHSTLHGRIWDTTGSPVEHSCISASSLCRSLPSALRVSLGPSAACCFIVLLQENI